MRARLFGRRPQPAVAYRLSDFVAEWVPKIVRIIADHETARLEQIVSSGKVNRLLLDGLEARNALRIAGGFATVLALQAVGARDFVSADSGQIDAVRTEAAQLTACVPTYIDPDMLELFIVQSMTGQGLYKIDRSYVFEPMALWAVLVVAAAGARIRHFTAADIDVRFAEVRRFADSDAPRA